jgi:hypothetical protein
MTEFERLVLENQKLILHGLRALLWKQGINGPASEVQDGMSRTHDFLRAASAPVQTKGHSYQPWVRAAKRPPHYYQ